MQVLDDRPLRMDSLPLQELSRLCSIPLAEVTANPADVAFACATDSTGQGIPVLQDRQHLQPRHHRTGGRTPGAGRLHRQQHRASFIYDSQNHGLPLDETTLARLMQGSAAVVPGSTAASRNARGPGSSPAWEPTPEPLSAIEAAPELSMPTEAETEQEPEPAPAPEPVQEPAPGASCRA